ncbi:hypothetical protein DDB_G0286587 [Dictyostelium discoideum AX4]|uniref:Uncharacterized protein n=1 Tax=Dictyostelium discoideum TaxID=44689 RepID=Q54LL4_DICDI|nr:hypothetical protein DDB_G0286587 [Dictyostelium discoideum AX4]EAL64049.1 hypothetical protein DDB_G0286587 [Dictyostelium discoideum AX4]|eukprot:XP_637547.1 hypothetical protein DDB_G0286587 [Dictyostelium discoideum AX4]
MNNWDSFNFFDDPTFGINLQPLTTTYVEVEDLENDIKRLSSLFYEETVHLSYKLPNSLKKSRNFLQPYLNIKPIKHSRQNYTQLTNSIDYAKVFVQECTACFDDNVGVNNLLRDILRGMDSLKVHYCSDGVYQTKQIKNILPSNQLSMYEYTLKVD